MTRRMIPPFNELRDGELADFYEVTRSGKPVMVALEELTYDEGVEIGNELEAEGKADSGSQGGTPTAKIGAARD